MPSMKARPSTLALALGLMIATAARGAGGFGSPVVVTGLDTGEPGIDVAPDGTIYVNAPAGLLSNLPGSPSFVFRSDDGGPPWTLTPSGGRATLPGGGDSHPSLHPATASPAGQAGCVGPPGSLLAEPGPDILGSGDRVGLIYATSSGGIKFARSTNGALTFTNVAISAASSADTTLAFPVVASAGNGSLH